MSPVAASRPSWVYTVYYFVVFIELKKQFFADKLIFVVCNCIAATVLLQLFRNEHLCPCWLSSNFKQFFNERLLVQEIRGSNPEPIKSLTRCQRLATVTTLMCRLWHKAAEMGTAHSWHPKGTKIWFEKSYCVTNQISLKLRHRKWLRWDSNQCQQQTQHLEAVAIRAEVLILQKGLFAWLFRSIFRLQCCAFIMLA